MIVTPDMVIRLSGVAIGGLSVIFSFLSVSRKEKRLLYLAVALWIIGTVLIILGLLLDKSGSQIQSNFSAVPV